MLSISLLIGILFGVPASAPPHVSDRSLASAPGFSVPPETEATVARTAIPDVPFYSQFEDIHRAGWQKIGCGIASLAMIIEYYHPDRVSVDTLLARGIDAGAYATNAGWKHQGLALLGGQYGLDGKSYDLATLDTVSAFARFNESLAAGPVIASVHYGFDPKSTIPHLVVITGIDGDRVYYNDPAATLGGQYISVATFQHAWKKRFIAFEPAS